MDNQPLASEIIAKWRIETKQLFNPQVNRFAAGVMHFADVLEGKATTEVEISKLLEELDEDGWTLLHEDKKSALHLYQAEKPFVDRFLAEAHQLTGIALG